MLETLVESRHSIDDAFGSLAEPVMRRQFNMVIHQMHQYLIAPSPTQLHESVSTWSATLMGMGLSPRSVLRTVVTVGDLIVQASKRSLPPGPETNLFVREVVRLNFSAARAVVTIFQSELDRQSTKADGSYGDHDVG